MKPLLVYFVAFNLITTITWSQNDGWHWTWSCNTITGQCIKSPDPVETKNFTSTNLILSHDICRLICGEYGSLWPLPTFSTIIDKKLVYFHPSAIKYVLQESTDDSLQYFEEITKIFDRNLNLECGGECTIQSVSSITINVTVSSHDTNLVPNADEFYALKIVTKESNTIITINGGTLFGVRHALETLSQLTASYTIHQSKSTAKQTGIVLVANAEIKDKPIYRHRGILLDTARNYLPIKSIKKQIDAMAASKMNVLHWHATDSQSFPLVSKRVPQLSKYGAYSDKHLYHLSDIRDLLLYGKHRGVRILMEIDAPSHAGNGWQWGQTEGLGDLAVCVNQVPWRKYCIQPPCGQLNPANENVYKVLGNLYADLLEIFPEKEYFHMGGDEVFLNCWNTTEEIISYMKNKGWKRDNEDFLKLWSEYQNKSLLAYDATKGTSDTPIILWSSQLTDPENIEQFLPKNRYIVHTWIPTPSDTPAKLLEKGYRLIITTKNAWYLDHGFWGSTQYYTWRTVYKNRIPRHPNVLGGEVCMWGEYVDKNSLDSRVWPRASAMAERLWSDPNLDTGAVETRFYRQRERLVTRGIAADPLAPKWCYQNEGECR